MLNRPLLLKLLVELWQKLTGNLAFVGKAYNSTGIHAISPPRVRACKTNALFFQQTRLLYLRGVNVSSVWSRGQCTESKPCALVLCNSGARVFRYRMQACYSAVCLVGRQLSPLGLTEWFPKVSICGATCRTCTDAGTQACFAAGGEAENSRLHSKYVEYGQASSASPGYSAWFS